MNFRLDKIPLTSDSTVDSIPYRLNNTHALEAELRRYNILILIRPLHQFLHGTRPSPNPVQRIGCRLATLRALWVCRFPHLAQDVRHGEENLKPIQSGHGEVALKLRPQGDFQMIESEHERMRGDFVGDLLTIFV